MILRLAHWRTTLIWTPHVSPGSWSDLAQRGVIMVAEHLMMQMLALVKRLRETEAITVAAGDWGVSRRTDEDTFAYNWSGRQGIGGLWRHTVGIAGFGEIGAELARRLAGGNAA